MAEDKKRELRRFRSKAAASEEEGKELLDHARLYSSRIDPEGAVRRTAADATLGKLSNCSTGTITGDIEVCVNALASKGLDVLVVDLTTRDVAEVGFRVARVLIPGLQPLHGDHRFRFLGGKRLYQAPKILRYADECTTEEHLLQWPHPFP